MDRVWGSMEEELYRKLDEDGGKKMIFKMARDRTEDGRDVQRDAVIKDNNGKLITDSKEGLRIWAVYFKELLNGKGAESCLELPSSFGERWTRGGDRRGRSGNSNAQDENARQQGKMKCG